MGGMGGGMVETIGKWKLTKQLGGGAGGKKIEGGKSMAPPGYFNSPPLHSKIGRCGEVIGSVTSLQHLISSEPFFANLYTAWNSVLCLFHRGLTLATHISSGSLDPGFALIF